jgi:SAM-dependent methyltransferase
METRLAFGVEPSHRRYRLRLARYPALAAAIAEFVRAAPGRVRLLDAGVGRGRTRRYLEPLGVAKRIDFHGVDLHPDLAIRCHDRASWNLVRADVSRPLPYRDATFDVVVCEQVLEHLDDPAAALAEIARCLRPGGLLVVGVPTFPPGVAWLRDRVAPHAHATDGHGHGHVTTFTKGAIVRLVRSTGAFDVRDVRGFRSFSGGIASALEDFRWWWRANAAFGRAFPSLCAEVQVVAARAGRAALETRGASPGSP